VGQRITFTPSGRRPLSGALPGSGSAERESARLLTEVAGRCRADAAVLLVREEDRWRVMAVAGRAIRGIHVGDVFLIAQNPSLSPEFSDRRPGLPSRAEPFLEALGPVALGDWITCPVVGPPGQVGLMHLITSWTRPFSNDDVEHAVTAADLTASVLDAARAAEGQGESQGAPGTEPDLVRAVSMLNHDLRSPLNAILGFAEMLADGSCPPDQVIRYSEIIHRSGESVLEMLDQLVAQMRITLGMVRWQPAEAPVRAFLAELPAEGDLDATALWDAVLLPGACRVLLDVVALLGGERRLRVRVDGDHAELMFGGAGAKAPADADEPFDRDFGGVPAQFAREVFMAHGATARVGGHGNRFTVRVPLRAPVLIEATGRPA